MGNVSVLHRFRRRLTKNSSGTISVSVPLEHAYELGWKKGDYVRVELQNSKLVVTKDTYKTKGGR